MKTYLKNIALAAVIGMAGAGIVGADELDKKTTITTDEVMQVPHATLQPGTYVIKLVGSPSDRHIVQFLDKGEKHVITTMIAIPNERLRATGKSVFAFWEVPAGQPKALRAWFYPGDDYGQEFAYPKELASRITGSNNGAKVPIEQQKDTDAAASAPTDQQSSTTVASNESTATAEPIPAPAEVTDAPAQPPSPPIAMDQQPANSVPAAADTSDAQQISQNTAPETLPRTASNLPLLAIIGLLAIVAAVGLNLAYNRS